MKKTVTLLLVIFLFLSFDICFGQVDSLAKAQLDTLIYNFVSDVTKIKNLTPEEELSKLVKDPYETTAEFKLRRKKIISDFGKYQSDMLKDTFYVYTKKTVLGIVELDSVKYDADKKIAKVFHRNIKIPNFQGLPKMDCFAYPALKYPFSWRTKEGFGLTKTDIRLTRKIARENDIIKSKGRLEYTIKLFRGKNALPSLRVSQVVWKIEDKTIWKWKGRTSIPKGINNKPLRGSD
ncbi:MAG: hypothetical protein ACEPO8_10035 [Rhodothermaceae bacterium]